jgi:hypothetical protein
MTAEPGRVKGNGPHIARRSATAEIPQKAHS